MFITINYTTIERLILLSLIKRYLFSYSLDTIYEYNMRFDNWTLLPQKLDMGAIGKFPSRYTPIIVGDDICDSTTTGPPPPPPRLDVDGNGCINQVVLVEEESTIRVT